MFAHVGVYSVQHVERLRLKSCFQRRDRSTNWPKNLKETLPPKFARILLIVHDNRFSGEKVHNKRIGGEYQNLYASPKHNKNSNDTSI